MTAPTTARRCRCGTGSSSGRRAPRPMTLVRIGWGATATVWAISLLPDIDPFFVEGDLLYERRAQPGCVEPAPPPARAAPASIVCLLLLAASAGDDGRLAHARLSSVVAVLMMVLLQRGEHGDLQLGRPAAAPDRHLRGARAVRAALVARRATRPPQGSTSATCSAPRTACASCSSAWRSATSCRRGRSPAAPPGTTAPRSRCRCASRTSSASSRRSGCSTSAVLLNLFTWATLAFEATFFVLVWNRRLRPWVLGIGVAFHLGIDLVPRHRLLQHRHLPRLPGLRPRRRRQPDRRTVRQARAGARPSLEQRTSSARSERSGGVGGRGSAGAPHREGPAPPDPTRSEPAEGRPTARGGRRRRPTRIRLRDRASRAARRWPGGRGGARWPAPFMIRSSASPWASTSTRASNTGTRSSSLPWTTSSGRGATFGAQADGPELVAARASTRRRRRGTPGRR